MAFGRGAFKYPRLGRTTAWRLLFILFLKAVCIFYIAVVAIHGTWWYKQWQMSNKQPLRWEAGLVSTIGTVLCEESDDPQFYAICMTVFKNTFGKFSDVERFICNLPYHELRIESQYRDHANSFVQSCADIQNIRRMSTLTLSLFLVAAACVGLGFLIVFGMAYGGFAWKLRGLYWGLFGCNVVALILQGTALAVYRVTIPAKMDRLFDYYNAEDPEHSLIWNADTGHPGSAIYLAGGAIAFVLVLLFLGFFWVPVVSKGGELVRTRTGPHPPPEQPTGKREAFWAFMPEVFQPNIYVAELPEQAPGVPITESHPLIAGAPAPLSPYPPPHYEVPGHFYM